MTVQAQPLIQTLIIYLFLGTACHGLGRAATHLLRISEKSLSPIILTWLGWAFSLLLFQLLHFFLPIATNIVFPILIAGTAFSIREASKALWGLADQDRSTLIRAVAIAIVMVAAAACVGVRSMGPPTNYDSGLYHFNAIRWTNTFPIVPGLGNLHGRLAFNQSFFTYVAALNSFHEHGRSLANSFLLLLAVSLFAYYLYPLLKDPTSLLRAHPFRYASALLALPVVGFLALSSDGLASPTPDLASTVLQLTIFVTLVRGVAAWADGAEEELEDWAPVIATLAATAITVKLSNLAFSIAIVGICLIFSTVSSRRSAGSVIRIVVPASLVIAVWILRGLILSGYPLFPSTVGHIAVDWGVPADRAVKEASRIYAWARQPGTTEWSGGWDWFWPWSARTVRDLGVMYPLCVSLTFCIGTVMIRRLFHSQKHRQGFIEWTILLPVAIGLVYWFFSAPDPRFAHALFWCLSIGSALLFLCVVQPLVSERHCVVLLAIVFTVCNLHVMYGVAKTYTSPTEVAFSAWQPVRTVPLVQKRTLSGMVVLTPQQRNQCWDSPLPCTTPEDFDPDLRLRIPGKLASGFVLARGQKHAEHALN